MQIIINADDFGMSHTKNLAVDEMMKKNICTNASLVVNMPDTNEAVWLAIKNGYQDRISLHLNLTVGESLTSQIRKVKLYYTENQFIYKPVIKNDEQVALEYISEIRNEIEAQINKFLDFGFKLRSIDSHNWIHLRLPVWVALRPVLDDYNIPIVRPMWSGYKRPEIASEKWSKYFANIEPILRDCSKYRIIEHTSNIEQFLVVETKITGYKYVELFTHPDMVKGRILDLSSSYLGKEKEQVINNVMLVKKYPKVSFNYILEELGL